MQNAALAQPVLDRRSFGCTLSYLAINDVIHPPKPWLDVPHELCIAPVPCLMQSRFLQAIGAKRKAVNK